MEMFFDNPSEVIQVIENRKNCRHGIVDWLKKLENEGQLEEFLKKMG